MRHIKEQKYFRSCPSCNKSIGYTTKQMRNRSERLQKRCNVCASKYCKNSGRFKRFKINDNYLDKIGIKQAWLIGMLATDGWTDGKKLVSINQSGKDGLNKIKYIKSLLSFEGNIGKYKTTCQYSYGIQFTSEKFVKQLAKHGIVRRKSLILKFSPIIASMSDKIKAAYIRGCIEGDGGIYVHKYSKTGKSYLIVSLASTSQFLKTAIKHFPIKPTTYKIKTAKNLIDIRWNCSKAVKIFNWLDNNKLYIGSKINTGRKYVNK